MIWGDFMAYYRIWSKKTGTVTKPTEYNKRGTPVFTPPHRLTAAVTLKRQSLSFFSTPGKSYIPHHGLSSFLWIPIFRTLAENTVR